MSMDMTKLMAGLKEKKAALKTKEKTLKPNPGVNRYILLPGWRKGEENVFFHDFGQHFIKNEAGEIQAVYQCIDATYGRPCPVCDGLSKAMKIAPDDEVVNVLKEAKAKQTFLMNVLALDSDSPDAPQILEVGKTVFSGIVNIVEEWASAVFDSAEPQIIIINREGKGMTTKYTVNISGKRHGMPKAALSKLNNLDDYVRQESEDNQRRALGAINTVAGILAAPTKDRPITSSLSEDRLGAALDPEVEKAPPAPVRDFALDAELDELMAGMGV